MSEVPRASTIRARPTGPPTAPARLVDDFTPALIDVGAHHLCPGCGEPIAMRSLLEAIAELRARRTGPIAVFGIGCYTGLLQQPRRRGRSRRCTAGPRRWPPGSSAPGPTPSSSPSKATATW